MRDRPPTTSGDPDANDPSEPRARRRLAAVWFVDIVDFTSLASRDETEALAVVELLQDVARAEVNRFGGRVVKLLGDGAMATFPSTEAAVASALAVAERFSGRVAASGRSARVRIGVHAGEVVEMPDGDLYGDGVNVAARVQGEGEPGTVVVSGDVARLLRSRSEFRVHPLGERVLKGIDDPVQIFRIEGDAEALAPRVERSIAPPPPDRTNRRALGWGAAGVLVLAGVLIALFARFPLVTGIPEAQAGELSIAVLPFVDLNPGADQVHVSEGITDDLLTQLARVGELRVISRASVAPFRESSLPAPEIAARLGVAHLLTGSVRRAGDDLRVSVQLVHAPSDRQLWAESYDRPFGDIFAIQTEIATQIVQELAARLSPAEERRIRAVPTESVEAYELFLQGRELDGRLNPDDNARAIERFRRAIEIDPDFALGHVGLADAFTRRGNNYGFGFHYADSAIHHASRAAALAPELDEARKSLGTAYLFRGWLRAGIDELEATLALSPSHAAATANLGLARFFTGAMAEAVRLYRKSVELNPGVPSLISLGNLADAYLILGDRGRAEEAIEQLAALSDSQLDVLERRAILHLFSGEEALASATARELLERAPGDLRASATAGMILLFAGDVEGAREPLAFAAARAPGVMVLGQWALTGFGTVHRLTGETAEAARVGREVRDRIEEALSRGTENPTLAQNLASAHMLMGEPDEALRVLEEGVRDFWISSQTMVRNPALAPLRDSPRFERVLEAAEAWRLGELARLDP